MENRAIRSLLILIVCLVGRVGYGQLEPVPVIDIDPRTDIGDPREPGKYEGSNRGNFNGVWGWFFTVTDPATVTHVAWYDENGDGLSHEHQIGFWSDPNDQAAELVFSSTIPEGLSADLIGPWRAIEIPSFTLPPAEYFVGGMDTEASSDVIKFVAESHPFPGDSRIVMPNAGRTFSVGDPVFGPPFSSLLVPGAAFGPMFFVQPIPEPCSFVLAAMAWVLFLVHTKIRCSYGKG